jgi:TonB family protein
MAAQDQAGKIVIYRPARFVDMDYNPAIFCDGAQVGTIVGGTYLVINAAAGPHNCVAESVQLAVTAFTVVPGEAVYLRANIRSGFKKHAFPIFAAEADYKRETKLTPLAAPVRLSGSQQLEPSSPISVSSLELSRKFGDLAIAATRLETTASPSTESPVVTVFVSVNNTGNKTICAYFAAHLETTSAESLDSIASSSPPDMHELSSGEIANGSFNFSLQNGQKPVLLWLQLQTHPIACWTSSRALVPDRSTPSAIMMDLHDLRGSGVTDPQAAKTAKPGVNGFSYPKCIHCPDPRYTEPARKAGFQGTIDLQVVINSDGNPGDIELIRSSGYVDLDREAIATVQTWRFKPSIGPDGTPTSVSVPVVIAFRLLKGIR